MKVMRYIRQGEGKSHRAIEAEQQGRLPITAGQRRLQKLLATKGIKKTLKDCRALLMGNWDGEWHHTGLYGRRTDYYDVFGTFAKVIAGNEREKQEVRIVTIPPSPVEKRTMYLVHTEGKVHETSSLKHAEKIKRRWTAA